MFNIGTALSVYATPLFAVLIVLFAVWLGYRNVKNFEVISKLEDEEVRKREVKKLVMENIAIVIVLGFLNFAFFSAYGPKRQKIVQGQESGYMQVLDEVDTNSKTVEERKAYVEEKRDPTGYLNQVGNKEDLKKEEAENAKLMDKYLTK